MQGPKNKISLKPLDSLQTPPWPMSTRLNCLPLANVIAWLTLLHLCKDDLRRTELGATDGSVTNSIVSMESKQAAAFCGHS